MKKKVLSMLLALSMTASLGVVNVLADETVVNKIPDEINYIVSHSNNNATVLNLSWINPDYEISAIEVTEPTLGNVSQNASLSLESGAVNYIRVENLEDGKLYTFTVRITKADGTVEAFTSTGKAQAINLERNTEEAYKTLWNFKYDNRSSRAGRYIDSSTKNSGNSSLKIVINKNDNAYVGILSEDDNVITFEEGKTYEFSFWSKNHLKSGALKWTDEYAGTFNASPATEWKKNTYTIKDVKDNGDGTWSYNVVGIDGVEVANTSENDKLNIRIVVDGVGTVWIDDIELYTIDADGTRTSKPYINGKFESDQGYYGTSSISASGTNGGAEIKWTNPQGTITEASVVDENLNTVATGITDGLGANSITLSDLTNGTLYNYYIKIVVNGVTQYIPVSVIPRDNSSVPYTTYDGYSLSGFKNWGWSDSRVKVTLDPYTKYAGNSSLHINFASGSWGGLWPEAAWGTLTTGKNYRLSVWAKNSANSTGTMRIDDTGGAKYIDIPEKTTEWTQFTYDFNATLNGLVHRINEVVPCTGDWWFDELEICEIDEIGGNVIGENVYKNYDYSFDGAGVKNAIAVPNETSATLSWINPVNAGITDVYLVDNGDVIKADNLSTVSGGKVSVKVEGLTENETYTYYAVINVANGLKIKAPIVFTANNNLPFESTMYTYSEQEFMNEVLQTKDTEVKYSGNSSLKLQSNYVNGYSCLIIPCYNLDTTKKYEVSFMYKSEGMSGSSFWTSDDWGERTPLAFNSDWKKATVKWAGKANLLIRLGLECSFDALWIDDVVVREIDDEGNYLSDNLLTDGGFEATNDKISPITFNEADGNVTANITEYNGFGLGYYLASYDADGKLIDVELVNADNVGKLVQTLTPSVTNGATVKAFVWDGMSPVATATK